MLLTVANNGNKKLGHNVASTSRLVGPTCPRSCPLLNGGCYAQRGRVALSQYNMEHGRQGTDCETAGEVSDALDKIRSAPLVRHLVAGDWLRPTRDGRTIVDREFVRGVIAWHRKRPQRYTVGWGYSHAAERIAAAGFGPKTLNSANLEVLASCHNPADVARLNGLGWRTARVVATTADLLPGEVACPYDLAKHQKETPDVTCASCRLCLPGRKCNIAFLKF